VTVLYFLLDASGPFLSLESQVDLRNIMRQPPVAFSAGTREPPLFFALASGEKGHATVLKVFFLTFFLFSFSSLRSHSPD